MALGQGWERLAWHQGDRVRKARIAAGYSQLKDLVEETGVPSQTLGPWESGARNPTQDVLARVLTPISHRLGVRVTELTHWVRTGESPT